MAKENNNLEKKKISDDFLYMYAYAKAEPEKTFRLFCSYLNVYTKDIDNPVKSFSYENWYPEQKKFDKERTGKDIVLKPRQIGFTALELARDLFFALTHPGAKVIVVAQNNDTRYSLMVDLMVFTNRLKELKEQYEINHIIPDFPTENKTQIHFAEIDSWIEFKTSGDNPQNAMKVGRGKSTSRLHLTEFAFWDYPMETLAGLLASAVDKFECVIECTANGTDNLFYQMYNEAKFGRNPYKAHFFSWIEHERYRMKLLPGQQIEPENEWEKMFVAKYHIDNEQLYWWKQQCSSMNLEKMLSEYPIDDFSAFRNKNTNKFLSYEEETWLSEIIISPVATEMIFDTWKLDIYKSVEEKKRYIVGCDPAGGTGNDFSVLYVYETKTWDLCATFASNIIAPYDFGDLIEEIGRRYNNAQIIWETNNHGIAVTEKLLNLQYPNLYSGAFSPKDKMGFVNTLKSRSSLMATLVELIRKRIPKGIDGNLANELKNFGYNNDRLEGINGIHDDHVMAWLMTMKLLEIEGLDRARKNPGIVKINLGGKTRMFSKGAKSPF